jgi:predicted nucleic acid-binding protein
VSAFFADTSVAVPLVVAGHREHEAVNAAVGRRTVRLASHAQLETYSVLTRLPGDARLAPQDAGDVLDDRFGEPVPLSEPSVVALLATLIENGIAGGAVYDALIGLTALESGAVLITRDRRAVPTFSMLGVEFELVAT